jgi:serine/tyrosine/threonine adenylyltransferase
MTGLAAVSTMTALYKGPDFETWCAAIDGFAADRPERLSQLYFQRAEPASLEIGEVEALWEGIAQSDDWALFDTKIAEIEDLRLALS